MGLLGLLVTPIPSSIILPLVLVLLGAFSEKLIRSEAFGRHHWLWGLQLAMTALCLCYVSLFEWVRAELSAAKPPLPVGSYALFLVLAIATLADVFYLLCEYQEDARRQRTRAPGLTIGRVIWLDLLGAWPLVLAPLILWR